jgi:hypothetical protein
MASPAMASLDILSHNAMTDLAMASLCILILGMDIFAIAGPPMASFGMPSQTAMLLYSLC